MSRSKILVVEDEKNIVRMVTYNLEWVADHATNIAEDVYDLVKGTTIQHRLAGE